MESILSANDYLFGYESSEVLSEMLILANLSYSNLAFFSRHSFCVSYFS